MMQRLKVDRFGTEAQGVYIYGDKSKRPEPTHFRVVLPFGEVDITRTTDDDYWIHVTANRPDRMHQHPEDRPGRFTDARIDCTDKHATDTASLAEPLRDPKLYHVAIRLSSEP